MTSRTNKALKCGAAAMLLAAVASLVPQASAAPGRGGVAISASTDTTVVTMGDQTRLHVSFTRPAGNGDSIRIVNLPEVDKEYSGVLIVSAKSDTSETAPGKEQVNYDFLIQAFDPGMVTFSPLAAVVGSSTDTVFSDIVSLKVLPVEVDSLETINPIAGVVAPHSRWYDIFPSWSVWVLLAMAALGVIGAVIYFLMHRKETAIIRRKVVVPPYELAMSRLNELQQRKLPENGHDKEYYTELVDILRQYLQGRFGINAMEMTTTQIVKALRSNQETRMTAEQMKPVLDIADFVKFAKVRPMPEDNVKSFSTAVNFVEQTKPAPEPVPEEGNKQPKP